MMHASPSNSERKANPAVDIDVAEIASGATSNSSLLQAARKLERLAQKVEGCLVEQFQQLDALLANQPKLEQLDLSREAERVELMHRQTAWERQKNEEFSRIEQERSQLADAWASLESEQRRALAEDALRRAQANASRDIDQTDDVADETEQPPFQAAHDKVTDRPGFTSLRESGSRKSVLVEFEQLKSDVQKHAKRLRRAR